MQENRVKCLHLGDKREHPVKGRDRTELSTGIQPHATRNPLQINVDRKQMAQALSAHTNLPRVAEVTLTEQHTSSKVCGFK